MATSINKPDPPAPPKRLTKAQLAQWDHLNEQRLELGRQAAAITRELRPIEEEFARYVDANSGGKVRRVVTCGYELAIEQRPKTPAWKALFARLAGGKKVDEAIAAAGTSDRLVIRRAA